MVLDFWASWCAVCLENFGQLRELNGGHGDNVRVVSINLDDPDRMPRVRGLLERLKPSWTQATTSDGRESAIWRAYGSLPGVHLALPLYVVVTQDGRIAGYSESLSSIRRLLDQRAKQP